MPETFTCRHCNKTNIIYRGDEYDEKADKQEMLQWIKENIGDNREYVATLSEEDKQYFCSIANLEYESNETLRYFHENTIRNIFDYRDYRSAQSIEELKEYCKERRLYTWGDKERLVNGVCKMILVSI